MTNILGGWGRFSLLSSACPSPLFTAPGKLFKPPQRILQNAHQLSILNASETIKRRTPRLDLVGSMVELRKKRYIWYQQWHLDIVLADKDW